MTLIVDASVGLKWFVEEEGSDLAVELIASRERLVAPDIVVSEICNGAWRLVRTNQLPPSQLQAITSTLGTTIDELFPSIPLAARALAIAQAVDHPVYDCFYVALGEVTESPVVTADARFIRRLLGTEWESRVLPLQAWRV